MRKIIILSSRLNGRKHVSYMTIKGLEDEFAESSYVNIICFSHFSYYLNKVSFRLTGERKIKDHSVLKKVLASDSEYIFFAAMHWEELDRYTATLKAISKKKKLIIYGFDIWESNCEKWVKTLQNCGAYVVFVAYKRMVERIKTVVPDVYWLPQSMNKKYFRDYGEKKDRIFIQIGRLTRELHKFALKFCKANCIELNENNYVYEKTGGVIIYNDAEELGRNINRTFFSLCAPKCIDCPEQTGKISEVTARFYESVACKCMIVGIKPKDSFDDLFPFDDFMIELDGSQADDNRIKYFLNNPDEYNRIVDRNYSWVMKHHTWRERFKEIQRIIEETRDQL